MPGLRIGEGLGRAAAPGEWPPEGLTIVIPGRPPTFGNLRVGHWAQRARLVVARRFAVEVCARSALASARLRPCAVPATVTATVTLAGPARDPDNLTASPKADLDGLARVGALADDGPDGCHPTVLAQRVAHHGAEAVTFRIVPDGEAAEEWGTGGR